MSATTLAVKNLHTNFKMTFTNINHHCLVLVEQFNKRKHDIYWLAEIKISICFSIKIKTNKKKYQQYVNDALMTIGNSQYP